MRAGSGCEVQMGPSRPSWGAWQEHMPGCPTSAVTTPRKGTVLCVVLHKRALEAVTGVWVGGLKQGGQVRL